MPSEKSWNRLSAALQNLEYDLAHLGISEKKVGLARDTALEAIYDIHGRFEQQRIENRGSPAQDFDAFYQIESDLSEFANSQTMSVLAPLPSLRSDGAIVLVRDAYEAVSRAAGKRAAGYEAELHFATIRDLLEQLAADVLMIAKEISESTTAQVQPGVRRGANLLDNIALFLQEFEVDENDHRTRSFVESTVGRVRTIVMEANYPSIEQACATIETNLTLIGGYVDQRIAALLTEDTDDIGDTVTSDASTASIDIGDQSLPPEFVGEVGDVLEVVYKLETAVARIVNEHPEQQARGQDILDRLRMIRDPLSEALHQGSLEHAIAVLAVGWQSAIEIDASAVAQLGKAANLLGMDFRVAELITKLGLLSNWPEDGKNGASIASPPPFPELPRGPRFEMVGGKFELSREAHADLKNADLSRLETLLPVIRERVKEAIALFGRNRAYSHIHSALESYSQALEGDAQSLNYTLIATFGVLLANAEDAANRSISDRLLPELEDTERAVLKTILDLHGPFILSTEEGRSLLADAAAYKRTEAETETFKAASIEFVHAINDEGLTSQATGEFLIEATENIGEGRHPSRSSVVGSGIVQSVATTVVVGGALLYLLPAVSPTALQWAIGVIVGDGIKRSRLGQSASNIVKDALDDPLQRNTLKRLRSFILSNETTLRRIAGAEREWKWLHDWLDWLKRQGEN